MLKKITLFMIISLILVFALLLFKGEDAQKTPTANNTIDNWAYDYVGRLTNNSNKSVKIAILDSGINKHHPELAGISFQEKDFLEEALLNTKTTDELNHGTPIAGIIAAKGERFKGIANNVELYDVRVLDSKGNGKSKDVINAINWCIEEKVDLINISFGFNTGSSELEKAVNKALKSNIIIVASAGNQMGMKTDFPARYAGVISVNSLNKEIQVSNISSQGKIDFSAPGEEVLSISSNGGYELYTGSSFATAFVTGSIASILSQDKNIDIKNGLLSTLLHHTVDLGEVGHDKTYGHGVIRLEEDE
jgi:minor extracellular protease Epr